MTAGARPGRQPPGEVMMNQWMHVLRVELRATAEGRASYHTSKPLWLPCPLERKSIASDCRAIGVCVRARGPGVIAAYQGRGAASARRAHCAREEQRAIARV